MRFTFLQWNVWYLEDIHNIAGYLKENTADIIVLQELTVNHPGQTEKDTPAYIAEQLGYEHCVGGEHFKEDNEERWFGNAIFSKYPIKNHRQTWINEPMGNGGFDDEYRTYLEGILDIDGTELIVATTHMSYTHEFIVTERKRKETDKLLDELKRNSLRKVIFSGDLNATPGSYTISQISNLMQPAGPDFHEKTWTTKPFSYQGFEERELNWRLDYIFTSKDVHVICSNIAKTDISDHLPMRAEFEI